MLRVIMLDDMKLSVIMLGDIMLSVIMLSVIMLIVIMLNVEAPQITPVKSFIGQVLTVECGPPGEIGKYYV